MDYCYDPNWFRNRLSADQSQEEVFQQLSVDHSVTNAVGSQLTLVTHEGALGLCQGGESSIRIENRSSTFFIAGHSNAVPTSLLF